MRARMVVLAVAGLALAGCMATSGDEPPRAGEAADAPESPPSAETAGDALTGGPAEPTERPAPTQTEPPEPTAAEPTATPLPDLGAAPELENEVWLNVDAPLRLADLRGQVVLLDMWTFG